MQATRPDRQDTYVYPVPQTRKGFGLDIWQGQAWCQTLWFPTVETRDAAMAEMRNAK